ncbi:phosphoglycerate dehydrogenase-like enzyme [Nocardioides luteus]|uniref:2-hydroxyacid dehydrogenase n=1 Tax=Nocardioides luteus TaxID=1844 RepID=A0ABQ5SS39_9ACTN|nr:D-2-hydroxyacid dehydrogenase family protein [Nocardioides luteus]MDR7311075.1 phosphoglycerate dehydrogenase-like enzyme [Nocardioides luteus]GGR68061.1 2-hydroxyacid dehydrogenase [Nocardioides luteus]GLJ66621.1 2-hydroxyacid dehydrogenase [Nocardioides luteus]
MRCVILDDYQDVATTYAAWDSLDGVEVTSLTGHLEPDALVEALDGVEIVVAMRERTPFPAAVLERLSALKLLVTTGMRNASIDLAAAARQQVTVCGTESSPHPPVELTWALIHALTRHLVTETTGHGWQRTVGTDLHGRTLGLVGLGKIGSRVAAVGQAFGMDVIAWSPHLTAERAEPVGVRAVDKATLFATSDIVSLHLVLSEATRHVVGHAELASMKPTAHLVNTSRAGLVDTDALVAHLGSGTIAGAGLDVFDVEPLPADDVLRHLPNVVTTPHLGYVTEDNYRRFYGGAVEDIAAWLAGDPVRTLTPKESDA